MGNSDSKVVKDANEATKVGASIGGIIGAFVCVGAFIFYTIKGDKSRDREAT
jgi:hypothetical protein